MGQGVAFVPEGESLLTGAVWHLSVDLGVAEYARLTEDLSRDLDELVTRSADDLVTRKEVLHLRNLVEVLKDKTAGIAQILPRVARSLISLGGKALKFLFGTAINEDIANVNHKIEIKKNQQGNLVHDTDRQITISRDLDRKTSKETRKRQCR